MEIDHIEIITAPFKEHAFIDYRWEDPSYLDLSAIGHNCNPDFTKDNKFDLQAYCKCLIEKLHTLAIQEIRNFVLYQCNKVKEPLYWINKLELLIELNHSVFIKDYSRYAKLLAVIEHARDKVQDFKIPTEPKYEFKKLKEEIEELTTYEEKLRVLKIRKTEFLQNHIDDKNCREHNYFKRIFLEEELLYDLIHSNSIFTKSPINSPIKGTINSPIETETIEPLRFTCNVNQFVDIFYQMKYEISVDKQPIITSTFEELVGFITKSFVDRNGKPLSYETVRTILNPSKPEKRPKPHKRIDISHIFTGK